MSGSMDLCLAMASLMADDGSACAPTFPVGREGFVGALLQLSPVLRKLTGIYYL